MDYMLGPLKGMCVSGIGICESVDSFAEVSRRSGTQPSEGLPPQYAEPTLHLIKPGGVGRCVMEMDMRILSQPSVMLWLMGIQVVKDDMEFSVRILCHDLVHEIQELPSATTHIVADTHHAGGHFQRSE